MSTISTEAWVLHARKDPKEPQTAQLQLEQFEFEDINENECLVEPIYGAWEGNMTHAMQRRPMDICAQRGEERVVVGNSGVVRVLRSGSNVTHLYPGDLCLLFPAGRLDQYGYVEKVLGYDAPGTMGVLAKRAKMHQRALVPLPKSSRYSVEQWAGLCSRYFTAWNNWNLAFKCYRLQVSEEMDPHPFVWGWGGGTTLAELQIAKFQGCQVAMISSSPQRHEYLNSLGIVAIDRRQFPDLDYDEEEFMSNTDFRKQYLQSEEQFLKIVDEKTNGKKVSIFIDYIGAPVVRATLLALSRQGVITSAGWKSGVKVFANRAVECIERHIHVNTHFAHIADGIPAVEFAEANNVLPKIDGTVTSWENIPILAKEFASGENKSYFPIFQVNSL